VESVAVVDTRSAIARRFELELDQSYSLARAILRDDSDAEDAVQDACLTAWRRAGSLRDPDRFGAWFGRILVNGCRDRLRGRQRQQVRAIALQAAWHGEAGGPDPALRPGASDPDLDAAFDGLDPDHRIVVLLRFWQDLSLDEIADRLDVPLGTVKSRLHYALRTLRTDLEASDGRL
jgi:RNA polymerase sigma-70 factor (ECF subfamily)